MRKVIGLVRTANMPSMPRSFTLFRRRVTHIPCTAAITMADTRKDLIRKAKPVPIRIAHVCLVDRVDESIVKTAVIPPSEPGTAIQPPTRLENSHRWRLGERHIIFDLVYFAWVKFGRGYDGRGFQQGQRCVRLDYRLTGTC